jgi:hypothetical protein
MTSSPLSKEGNKALRSEELRQRELNVILLLTSDLETPDQHMG